jgi:hypothetical protein
MRIIKSVVLLIVGMSGTYRAFDPQPRRPKCVVSAPKRPMRPTREPVRGFPPTPLAPAESTAFGSALPSWAPGRGQGRSHAARAHAGSRRRAPVIACQPPPQASGGRREGRRRSSAALEGRRRPRGACRRARACAAGGSRVVPRLAPRQRAVTGEGNAPGSRRRWPSSSAADYRDPSLPLRSPPVLLHASLPLRSQERGLHGRPP